MTTAGDSPCGGPYGTQNCHEHTDFVPRSLSPKLTVAELVHTHRPMAGHTSRQH